MALLFPYQPVIPRQLWLLVQGWDGMTYAFGDVLRHSITQNLAAFAVARVADESLRDAAVALVVTGDPDTGEATLLLTLRSAGLRRHSNQYALPGGRLDEGETIEQAGLRELHEELGLEVDARTIIGTLDDMTTRSGFRISPIVVWGPEVATLVPDPGEVDTVFRIPLSELDGEDILHLIPADDQDHPVLSLLLPSVGHFMYAPTAAILYQFREVALRGSATRVAHYGHPEFAWK